METGLGRGAVEDDGPSRSGTKIDPAPGDMNPNLWQLSARYSLRSLFTMVYGKGGVAWKLVMSST